MQVRSFLNRESKRGCTVYWLKNGFILETWEGDRGGGWNQAGLQICATKGEQ